jgi:hypothetical protein
LHIGKICFLSVALMRDACERGAIFIFHLNNNTGINYIIQCEMGFALLYPSYVC